MLAVLQRAAQLVVQLPVVAHALQKPAVELPYYAVAALMRLRFNANIAYQIARARRAAEGEIECLAFTCFCIPVAKGWQLAASEQPLRVDVRAVAGLGTLPPEVAELQSAGNILRERWRAQSCYHVRRRIEVGEIGEPRREQR